MAIAMHAQSDAAFTLYEREPDRIEQIRGAAVDPDHRHRVAYCLERILGHRADCGMYPARGTPVRTVRLMQLAGYRERVEALSIGGAPRQFLSAWMRKWQ